MWLANPLITCQSKIKSDLTQTRYRLTELHSVGARVSESRLTASTTPRRIKPLKEIKKKDAMQ